MDEKLMQHEELDENEDNIDVRDIESDEEQIYLGTIRGFQGSWMSGLATLILEDENGQMNYVSCDNGTTARSLEMAFGNVLGNAHNVKENGGHIGQKIFYVIDYMNVMEWFIPIDEAPEELIQEYNRQHGQMSIPDFAM